MQKGGLKKEVDFNIFIKNGIFKPSTDKLYFKKKKKSSNKIYLVLHDNGIIEYNGKFYKQGQSDYKLLFNDSVKIDIPENINKEDELPVLYDLNDLKNILFEGSKIPKTKSLLQFLYYTLDNDSETKENFTYNEWLPAIGKTHNFEKEKISKGKPWISKNDLLIKDSKNYVLSLSQKRLRFIKTPSNIFLKAVKNWSFKNLKVFIEEFNNGTLNTKFIRQRREISLKKNLGKEPTVPPLSNLSNESKNERTIVEGKIINPDDSFNNEEVVEGILISDSQIHNDAIMADIIQESKESQESKKSQESQESKKSQESQESKKSQESKESQESKKSQESQESKKSQESQESPIINPMNIFLEETQKDSEKASFPKIDLNLSKKETEEKAEEKVEEKVEEKAISQKTQQNLTDDRVFNEEEVIQKLISGVTLNEFIEISKLKLRNLDKSKYYTPKVSVLNKYKSLVKKKLLRIAIIKEEDNIKKFLYKPDNWYGNEEAFLNFKEKHLNPIILSLEREKHMKERKKSNERMGSNKSEGEQGEEKGEGEGEEGEKGEEKVNLKIKEVERNEFQATEFKNDGNCEEILESVKDKDITVDSPEYHKYKTCIEEINKKRIKNNEIPELYPHLDDDDFNKKIFLKKEFNETKYDEVKVEDIQNIEEKVNELCNPTEFQLSPHQMFVRNYLSFNTPYNSLLLFHGLGTGKTCSSITVTEEMRQYLKQMNIEKKIIIVASPVVQENYKMQLFDERKLQKVGGVWNIKSCTGNIFIKEINPINSKISREKLVSQINKIIKKWYVFMGYNQFSNYINKMINRYRISDDDNKEQKKRKKKLIQNEFSNRMIVIDEVQNIRNTKKIKKSSNNFLELVKYTDNLKLILLTATPMYNNPEEIVWLLNLMNINDNRVPISVSDVFDKNGEILVGNDGQQIGKELLIRKMRGYISYVRGENPFTFPNAIYPYDYGEAFSIKSLMQTEQWSYPSLQMNDKEITDPINFLDILITPIGEEQGEIYNYAIEKLKLKNKNLEEEREGLQYTIIDPPLQILNFAYPHQDFNYGEKNDINYKLFYGKEGLERISSEKFTKTKKNFKYKDEILEKYGRIFSPNEIGKYSSKMEKIISTIKNSNGIVLIYSQFIDGGCVPIALALEEIGITRFDNKLSLFKNKPVDDIDAINLEPKNNEAKTKFFPAKYAMITGDPYLSPRNKQELKACTDTNNINGEVIKVIIISKAGSEGLDFKNIRQVHILEPWFNFMRTSQTIGRAIRNLSHCALPYIERNAQIFLYGTELKENRYEAIDMYMYRLAEKKGIKIGKVARLLKENAIDCLLNYNQTQMYQSLLNKTVLQNLSTNEQIEYKIGDREFSVMCDFMECKYGCNSKINEDDKINSTTYNNKFLLVNSEIIIKKIKELFTQKYVYTRDELIKFINYSKEFPLEQINAALDYLIENKNENLVDIIGRNGFLKNINNIYLFHPIELNETAKLTNYKLRNPIQYKPEKLVFRLNNTISKKITQINKSTIIEKLNKSFYILNQEPKSKNLEKQYNWEYNAAIAIFSLVNYNNIDKLLLVEFCIHHIIDTLLYNEKVEILKIINKSSREDELTLNETLFGNISNYFEQFAFFYKEKKYYIIRNEKINKYRFSIITVKNDEMEELQINTALFRILGNKFKISIDEINSTFGFIGKYNASFVFKTKEFNLTSNKKNNTGVVCRGNKPKLIKLANIFHKENGDEKFFMNGKKITNIYGLTDDILKKHPLFKTDNINLKPEQICIEIQLLLQYYNYMKLKEKKWFFFSIFEILYGIRELPVLSNISTKIIN